MKVCLDARSRSGAGVPVYLRNLVPRLIEGRPDVEFVVLAHEEQALGKEAGETIRVPATSSPAAELLWVQTCLPTLLERRSIDLYHGLKHPGPLLCPCPAVLSIHEVGQYLERRTLPWLEHVYWRRVQPLAVARTDHVVVPSDWCAGVLRKQLDLTPEAVSVVPYGVAPVFRTAPSGEAASGSSPGVPTPYLLAVGNINPKKNFGVVLEALKRLENEGRCAPTLVVAGGRGYRADAFDSRAAKLGLQGRVVTTGFVAPGRLAILYRNAKALVYPSLYESFGLPPLEAMAVGCRVIASERAAIPEVTGGLASYVDDPEDPVQLAAVLADVLDEPAEERRRRIEAGREWASRYSWELTAERTAGVYDAVLGPR